MTNYDIWLKGISGHIVSCDADSLQKQNSGRERVVP